MVNVSDCFERYNARRLGKDHFVWHSGALPVALEAAEFSVPLQARGLVKLCDVKSGLLITVIVFKEQPGGVISPQSYSIQAC